MKFAPWNSFEMEVSLLIEFTHIEIAISIANLIQN